MNWSAIGLYPTRFDRLQSQSVCGKRPIQVKRVDRCCPVMVAGLTRALLSGLRDRMAENDSLHRCRCGNSSALAIYHDELENRTTSLITLCTCCRMQMHPALELRDWVPPLLLTLWLELDRRKPLRVRLEL